MWGSEKTSDALFVRAGSVNPAAAAVGQQEEAVKLCLLISMPRSRISSP